MSKEIEYQNRDNAGIERLLTQRTGKNVRICMEEFSDQHNSVLQTHAWIISGSLPEFGIVGLKEKIREFNTSSIEKTLRSEGLTISVDHVLDSMVEDFQTRFENAYNGYETYPLIFLPNNLQRDKTRQRLALVGGVEFSYDVIYYEWMNRLNYQQRNAFSIIREKRVPTPGQEKSHQRPDFAVYINGIPLMFIEYKTEDSGIKEAIADLENKSTYRKVPFYVATNGRECAVICNIEQFNIKDSTNANAYLWKVHRHTEETLNLTDIECFYHELLCQPEHLYFYITQITSLDHTRQLLKNGRVQQYYAVKNFHAHLLSIRNKKQREASNLAVFHTQRSGKTVTMKFMAQLVLNHYSDVFQYIFVYAPDLQIKKILTEELNATGGQSLITIDVIGSEAKTLKFENVIQQMHAAEKLPNNTERRIYIVNMQQLKIGNVPAFKGFNVLNIIDEGHHGQAGELAGIREKVLPNATNVLFTATPKESTYVHYLGVGEEADAKILDRFTFSQAKLADIVVNVLYIKPATFMEAFKKSGKMKNFLDAAELELGEKFDDDAQAYDTISAYSEDAAFANSAKARFAQGVMQQIHVDLLPAKINYIVEFQKKVQASLTHEDVDLFQAKAIVYTQNIEHARAYIQCLRQLNADTGNVYGNLRFALDYAAMDEATCLIENDGLGLESIEPAFRNQDTAGRIDILIAVNKYQKGYDLPELTTVFLDKNIQEPSLINQIYTRPATKRRYKAVGYSVDLTLGKRNKATFDASVALYDAHDGEPSPFITEDTIKEIERNVDATLAELKIALDLTQVFTKERILQAVLNPPLEEDRQPRQSVFFAQSKALFKFIDQLKSPLYFQNKRLEISALYYAFVEFKEIYADSEHPDNSKIKINLDASLKDAYLTKKEIQQIIDDILGVMQEKSLATLLDFKYSMIQDLTEESSNLADWANLQKKEERKADLLKAVKLTESFLEEQDKSLYDLVKALLDKLSDDRTAVYDDSVQSDIQTLLAQVRLHQEQFQKQLRVHYQGSAFIYYVAEGLQKTFPLMNATVMAPLYIHVGARLLSLYKQSSNATARHLSIQEQIKECVKKMTTEPSFNLLFTLIAFAMDYSTQLAIEDKKVLWHTIRTECSTHGYNFEEFKNMRLDSSIIPNAIAYVHQLQGHF